jgi:hypothetical protein
MTEKRNRPESDSEVGALVSRTYKELAGETTPEHLDRAVLKQAADAARPRYLRSITWTRPMAWAAIITLCVGLVLEVTKVPEPASTDLLSQTGRPDAPAPTSNLPETAPAKAEATRFLMEEVQEQPVERKRAAKMNAAVRPQAALVPASATPPEPESPACDETETATAAAWLICIKNLEDAGRMIEANEQRALYDAAHPANEPL